MKVESRSKAESTSEAVREIEEEYNTATALAATSSTFTMVLTDHERSSRACLQTHTIQCDTRNPLSFLLLLGSA